MILPAMGVMNEVVTTFVKNIFGYSAIAYPALPLQLYRS